MALEKVFIQPEVRRLTGRGRAEIESILRPVRYPDNCGGTVSDRGLEEVLRVVPKCETDMVEELGKRCGIN